MKFNITLRKATAAITNHVGVEAYRMSPALELYTAVATCLVEDAYYERNGERMNRIRMLVAACAPSFVARLAVYARTTLHLRSIPVVLATELARIHRGDDLVRRTVAGVVQRVDEISELLANYQLANERHGVKKLSGLSKQVQKGLADAFNRFDEYQFAKYRGNGAVQLRDALFLVHPKAKDEAQQATFDRIASGTLETPYTWETQLSALGQQAFADGAQKAAALEETWSALVSSGRMGYMATLRNLCNLLRDANSETLDAALTFLADARQVQQSRQLPFRYLSALEEVSKLGDAPGAAPHLRQKAKQATAALETALAHSCENIRTSPGRTAILSDNSGSMYGDGGGKSLVSAMSRRKTADIANLFAVLYRHKRPDAYVGLFGDRLVEPALRTNATLLEAYQAVSAAAATCGGATERGIFEYMDRLIRTRARVDRIVIFSDCQVGPGCGWYDSQGNRGTNFNTMLKAYRAIHPAVKVYSVDLRGYGNTMVHDNAVLVSGWSEKLFDMIDAVEQGASVEEVINAVNL